jgi:hypothetical protein
MSGIDISSKHVGNIPLFTSQNPDCENLTRQNSYQDLSACLDTPQDLAFFESVLSPLFPPLPQALININSK